MELTLGEIEMLRLLSQIPFLPVARRMGDDTPVYLEDSEKAPEEYSLILQILEQKRLVSLDYDMPLANFSGKTYHAYPVKGSVALTERGQKVLSALEIDGIS